MKLTSLRDRYHAALITVADLRQDLHAQSLGLATDFTPEETRRFLQVWERKLADLREAYLTRPGGAA
jgi:hypothetical protein